MSALTPLSRHYTPDGRYIPRGGGSRGWFDNAGVAGNERMNHYRYHDAAVARGMLVGAESDASPAERRIAERKATTLRVQWSREGEPTEQPGSCHDLTLEGAGLRIRQELRADTRIAVTFLYRQDRVDEGHPLATLSGRVAWCAPAATRGRARRFDIGLAFDAPGPQERRVLERLLEDRGQEMVPDPAEAPETELPGVDTARMLRPARDGLEL